MKFYQLFTLLCCISVACCANVQLGTCYLKGTTADSTVVGTVRFSLVSAGQVQVDVAVTGITVSTGIEHGMHVHQYGDISDAASASTGAHWNPGAVAHACPGSAVRHMGDMGNWTVSAGGDITQSKTLDLITLTGGTSIIGRAVVLHAGTDDCVTQTTGNSGSRLAHCVIGIADPNTDTNIAVLDDATLTSAVCVLTNASGSTVSGLVVLTQTTPTSPTRVVAQITGLTGPHGFHIHSFGDVSSPQGTLAGSHYNPLAAPHHGIPPYPVRHMGDMGNIVYFDNSDVAYYDYTNDQLSLSGANSIFGRTIIVHSAQDDCASPVGNSGSRVAQCVIGTKNPATVAPTLPVDVPATQDDTPCNALYTNDGTGTDDGSSNFASVNSVAFGLLALALLFCTLF
jgi:superoxide dismutase, Cu-Zn family